jgi:hypothetical protein
LDVLEFEINKMMFYLTSIDDDDACSGI